MWPSKARIIGVSSNYILSAGDYWKPVFTSTCFDAFATGAFLSWLIAYRSDMVQYLSGKFRWIGLIALLLMILMALKIDVLPPRTVHSFFAITVIFYCLFKNNNRPVNFILNNKWLMRIGKVSYGVYLFHLFIPELWGWILAKFNSWP